MNGESRVSLRWPVVLASVVALLAIGAGGAFIGMRHSMAPPAASASPVGRAANPPAAASSLAQPEVEVSLTEDAMKRAAIELAPVSSGPGASSVRIPGTVEANAYKQVVVTPLVAGRVTRVLVELGAHVRQGQTLAQVFSPELAEAQTRYLSTKAELEAHERELDRTRKLVDIGAASQQELERLHAEHSAKVASLQSLRSRLVLLGIPSAAIDALSPGKEVEATTNIPAPLAGVVTERNANMGLNVDTATKLFTVVDLSTVWVVGALYEKDFWQVRIGSSATVTTTAFPGLSLQGRVNYIDPQVSPDTRTARVRVEVANPRQELRLGMYVDMEIAGASDRQAVTIPRSAVQTVGDKQVVYIANPQQPGKFVEREVRLGGATGEQVQVLSGVKPGDEIVANGSFFLRAERERLGLPPPSGASAASSERAGSTADPTTAPMQATRIVVGDEGYEPSRVSVRAGSRVRLTFVRTSDKTCGTAVTFPSLNIRRDLPLNQPVEIDFTPEKTGEIQFVCGVNMLRGTVVVQ